MRNLIRLEELRKEALAKADALVEKKRMDYGEFSDYPLIVLASLNYVKSKRILELSMKLSQGGKEANEPLEDSCVDGINYQSFIYSMVCAMKEERP